MSSPEIVELRVKALLVPKQATKKLPTYKHIHTNTYTHSRTHTHSPLPPPTHIQSLAYVFMETAAHDKVIYGYCPVDCLMLSSGLYNDVHGECI
jgi:hypothetical protein